MGGRRHPGARTAARVLSGSLRIQGRSRRVDRQSQDARREVDHLPARRGPAALLRPDRDRSHLVLPFGGVPCGACSSPRPPDTAAFTRSAHGNLGRLSDSAQAGSGSLQCRHRSNRKGGGVSPAPIRRRRPLRLGVAPSLIRPCVEPRSSTTSDRCSADTCTTALQIASAGR